MARAEATQVVGVRMTQHDLKLLDDLRRAPTRAFGVRGAVWGVGRELPNRSEAIRACVRRQHELLFGRKAE